MEMDRRKFLGVTSAAGLGSAFAPMGKMKGTNIGSPSMYGSMTSEMRL